MSALEASARSFFLRCRAKNIGCNAHRRKQLQTQLHRRWSSSTTQPSPTKPYYVTSPIFYVNAEPHAGHLYTLILTDVLKRWQVLKGDKGACMLTGTDEHGMKIQKAAEKAKTPTKAFCDKHAQQFLALAGQANISFDRFIRTTDEDHKNVVEQFWRDLRQRDYIYESKHEGWYSVSDETFYPQSQVHLILDPSSGRKLYASIETGKEVEWTSEMNYHFRLSMFKDRLLKHYRDNPNFIVPTPRMNFIIREVESGLQDLSISRPSSRLQWGIKVPDDESQTIYVWLDALLNYLTMTGYPVGANPALNSLWPPNAQVIGKDIIRFHTIYWPAFLMALELPLPKSFLTHAHWTLGAAKMSKSLGNGVNPFYAMERYGVDTIRYFMTHDGGILDDADYDNTFIAEKYKKGLQGGLGNLTTRLLRSRLWTLEGVVETAEKSSEKPTDAAAAMIDLINQTVDQADQSMDQLNPRQALQTIMELVYETNKFVHDAAPWNVLRQATEESKTEVETRANVDLFVTTEAARIACILLQPFMPQKMEAALDLLAVDKARRTYEFARYGMDYTYGRGIMPPSPSKKDRTRGTLFPPLATEF